MMKNLLAFVLRAAFVLTGTALVTFFLLWNAPGDLAQIIALARYDALVTQEVIALIREEAGLNSGFWTAFASWAAPLLSFDFGRSAISGREVLSTVVSSLSYTFPLALAGLAVGIAISLPLAIIATKKPKGLLDRFSVAIASLGVAIPAYWLGLLLILLFAVQLGWLPAMGARTPAHAILPAITLGLGVAASLTRIIRSSILEAQGQAFLPALKRRGVSAKSIRQDHIALHSAIPVITLFGLEWVFLLEGAVMVEIIFARPGLGTLLFSAIEARDFPIVQAVVLLVALFFVTVNLCVDILYQIIDPRIGESHA